jgi:hypothetical protein
LDKAKTKKESQEGEDGESGQGDGQGTLIKGKKKTTCKGLDDKASQRSKRTKSDNEGSAQRGKGIECAKVNLEAIKGSLKKKGDVMASCPRKRRTNLNFQRRQQHLQRQ